MLDQTFLDELWSPDDPVVGEGRIHVELAEGAYDDTERAELMTQLARSLGLQGRFAEAHELLDAVAGLDVAEPGGDSADSAGSAVAARVALERGRVLRAEERGTESDTALVAALAAADRAGHEFLGIEALTVLGVLRAQAGDASGSAAATAEAISRASRSTNDRTRRWLVALHGNRGWLHLEAGDRLEALAELTEAAHWADLVGTAQQRVWAEESLAGWTARFGAR